MRLFGDKISKDDAARLSAITLAFVGDAVEHLFVRATLAQHKRDFETRSFSPIAANVVCAEAQADLAKKFLPLFTEEENYIYKRAKNARKRVKPKHATFAEYNAASGVEAVFGFLYLTGEYERLEFLLSKVVEG
ncbi:MAG: Mini-ribonuclease 3 [Clostridia bacterium]|nr:Mini-ribonuclease 3 [Clostridia bacterium]